MASRVYVIILHWNRLEDTLECIASLQRLDYPDYRLLVVDNGSGSDCAAAIGRPYPAVTLMETESNLGYVGGNNIGIRHALEQGADYIFILNNDTVAAPDAVSQLVKAARDVPRAGIVSPAIISYHDPSIEYAGTFINWRNATGGEQIRSSGEVFDTEYAPGCALLAKSEVIRRIGMFDPAYFAYFEDVDLSLRCKASGYRVLAVPQAKIFHKGTVDRLDRKSPTTWFYFRRNQCIFIRKHGRWRARLPFLKRYTGDCFTQVRELLRDREPDKAEAVLDGWWAGITCRRGAERTRAPKRLKSLLLRWPGLVLWLTSPIESLRHRFPIRTTLRRIRRSAKRPRERQ